MGDTIYALASGTGRAGVAVIRISGPGSAAIARDISGSDLPRARMAVLRRFREPETNTDIDEGLLLWFPRPHSFTGEDIAEFHVHGGPAIVEGLAAALTANGRCRLAEPGEFTRRAFENGKLDLTAAEAVADLVEAQTVAQQRLALRQYDGGLADLYEGWRQQLVRIQGHMEAEIDFSDEEIPENLLRDAKINISGLGDEITRHLDDGRRGERIRSGFAIAIIGAPNAGKSSLLNRLAARDVAIVSEQAGTTRDVIEAQLNLGGYMVVLADTAGLRDPQDAIEAEGVRRAEAAMADADLRVLVVDGSREQQEFCEKSSLLRQGDLVAFNKCDLFDRAPPSSLGGCRVLPISARTGAGTDALLDALAQAVAERLAVSDSPALTRIRHREALHGCGEALDRALAADMAELAAEDVRLAIRHLGRITGRVDVDEVLDVVFRDFCIGK